MSRITMLGLLVALGFVQLYWLFSTWRRDGFGAAFKLFLYGVLSSIGVFMQYELGL